MPWTPFSLFRNASLYQELVIEFTSDDEESRDAGLTDRKSSSEIADTICMLPGIRGEVMFPPYIRRSSA